MKLRPPSLSQVRAALHDGRSAEVRVRRWYPGTHVEPDGRLAPDLRREVLHEHRREVQRDRLNHSWVYQIGPRRRSFDGHAAMHGGHGGHGGGASLDGSADGAPGRRDADDGPPASPDAKAAAKAIRHLAHVEHAISYSRALQSESVALEPRKNHELDGYVHHDAHKPFELPDDTLRRREPHLGHHHHHGYGSGDDVSEHDDDASVGSVEIRLARQGSYVGEEGITMDIELEDDGDDDEEKDARGAGGAAPAAAVELAAPHSPPRNPLTAPAAATPALGDAAGDAGALVANPHAAADGAATEV